MSSNNKDGFVTSLVHAMRPSNLIMKALYMFGVITVLSIREFIYYLNLAGEQSQAWWTAIFPAYREGLAVIFTSIWSLIVDIASFEFNYLNQDAYGNMIFGTIFILGAIYVTYQPVALFIDIIDGKQGDATSMLVKISWTLVAVVVISSIVFYSGGAESVLSTAVNNSTVVENVTTNVTNSTSDVPTISLI